VILTAALRDEEVSELMTLGASGIVLKESSSDALLACVRQVHQGKRWMDPETLARGVSGALSRTQGNGLGTAALTAREREVVRLVGEGMRNKEIAERLSISEGTVKIHLHNVYDKLGVDGRLELVLLAQQKGLL
jgi:two-component system, NarL family, nitrate/nitrite response regulator NarL